MAAAKSVRVGDVVQKDMGFVPGVHYIVTDASGKSVVLEYIGGELKVHANPLGVMTNSPTFDWHMTNLSNYVNMSRQQHREDRPRRQGDQGARSRQRNARPARRFHAAVTVRSGGRLFQDVPCRLRRPRRESCRPSTS